MSRSPIQAAAAFRRGDIDSQALAWDLLSWPQWLIPTRAAKQGPAPALLHEGDDDWIVAFSDEANLQTWAMVQGVQSQFIEVDGPTLVAMTHDDLAGLVFDPETLEATRYRRDQFAWLREIAAAVEVQAVLHGRDRREDPWGRMRRYAGWSVLLHEDSRSMALAPDTQGRKLAAVFTDARAAQDFAQGVKAAVTPTQMVGQDLFQALTRMPIDGIVFFSSGPDAPKALKPAFARVVMGGSQ